jgi:Polyketide cyclase / dehydrase and lipid transport
VDINADRETVWKIISDLENEPDYWYGTKSVRTISKTDCTISREITQNFRNHKILQEVTQEAPDYVEIRYLHGLTTGTKTMKIESISKDTQRLRVVWRIRFSGIFKLATPIIKRHTANGTVNALKRIKAAAEIKRSEKI